jgi:hypothetical protein
MIGRIGIDGAEAVLVVASLEVKSDGSGLSMSAGIPSGVANTLPLLGSSDDDEGSELLESYGFSVIHCCSHEQ